MDILPWIARIHLLLHMNHWRWNVHKIRYLQSLAPGELQIATSRSSHLHVVDLRSKTYETFILERLPSTVKFIEDTQVAFSCDSDLNIMDIGRGVLLYQFSLRDCSFPTHCVKPPNCDYLLVACIQDDEFQIDGCVYRCQLQAPFLTECICDDVVNSFFFAWCVANWVSF